MNLKTIASDTTLQDQAQAFADRIAGKGPETNTVLEALTKPAPKREDNRKARVLLDQLR